jgi:prolyl oligopeptidase
MRTRLFLPLLLATSCATAQTPAPLPTSGVPGHVEPVPAGPRVATPAPPPPSRFPASRRGNDADVLHGVAVADPYRWLEDAATPEVQAWMKEQDGVARAQLAKLPARELLAKRYRELLYIDAISPPMHEGKRWFFSRKHADKEKTIVYYRDKKDGADKVLFDPNTLSADGSVSLHAWSPSYDGRYVAYALSQNNSDSSALHIRDLDSGKDLPEVIEDARYARPSWTADSKGFYYTWIPKDPSIPRAEMPGLQEVRYHQLGDDPAKDNLVVAALHDSTKFISADASRDGRFLFGFISHGSASNDIFYKDLKAPPAARKGPAPIDRPNVFEKAGFLPLAVGQPHFYGVEEWKGQLYIVTEEGAPRWHAFKVDAKNPARDQWKEIIPAREDANLDTLSIVGGRLIVSWKRNAQSELEVRDLDGRPVRKVELPGLGTSTGFVGRPDEDEAYFSFTSFTSPPEVFKTSAKSGKTTLWEAVKIPVDTSNMTAEQVWYPSKDGTKVSMFLVHRKDWQKNGENPVFLTGYGGFDVGMTPYFSSGAAIFLEHGGVFALPNLRGGDEYGEDWHKGGMLDKKQNVFDDFIGAAEYLVTEKISNPSKIAISGGSNGGLLVGAVMVQRPELFGAVICAVPLLDMVRYHKFGSGMTWTSEYGNAEDEAQFRTLFAYSPYHHVQKGVKYPPLLMMSADSDDRVDPMHARKFTAAIQWATSSEAPVLIRIETHAGHGGGDMVSKSVDASADSMAFVFDALGMK